MCLLRIAPEPADSRCYQPRTDATVRNCFAGSYEENCVLPSGLSVAQGNLGADGEWGDYVPVLSGADYRGVLELVAEALRHANPEFPDATVTGFLRDVFQAEFAGAGHVDFCGTASRTWADSPRPVPADPDGFHEYAVGHPLARAYQRTGEAVPLRLSDVASIRAAPPAYGGTGMSRVLTIPLVIAPEHVCALALQRGGSDFTARDLQLASQLQPVLSGVYALRNRIPCRTPSVSCTETGIRLTARELAVLDLMGNGLIAAAIARQLCISPRTVNKHIENIYRKLGTHDRTSAVLRGQDLGIIHPGANAT
jgi:DNA-binding CsgD family transcriptional regulator